MHQERTDIISFIYIILSESVPLRCNFCQVLRNLARGTRRTRQTRASITKMEEEDHFDVFKSSLKKGLLNLMKLDLHVKLMIVVFHYDLRNTCVHSFSTNLTSTNPFVDNFNPTTNTVATNCGFDKSITSD